jgi:FMN-dependent NADH-azoreductase
MNHCCILHDILRLWGGLLSPAAVLEHLETYLRGVFGFIGVANPELIVAEGLLIGTEQREHSMQRALQAAAALRAA